MPQTFRLKNVAQVTSEIELAQWDSPFYIEKIRMGCCSQNIIMYLEL